MKLRVRKVPFAAATVMLLVVALKLSSWLTHPNNFVQLGAFIGLVVIAYLLFRGLPCYWKPAVIVDHVGIEDTRSRIGIIPWEDIRSLRVEKSVFGTFLCIVVDEPEKVSVRRTPSSIAA